MYFHYFVIISHCRRTWTFIWTNLNPFHPRMRCAKFGSNWHRCSGKEYFYILSVLFHYFVIISPCDTKSLFIWTNLNRLHPTMLRAMFSESGPLDLVKKIFKCCQFFSVSQLSYLFIWTNLYPLYPRMLCAKFGWNWLSGSE